MLELRVLGGMDLRDAEGRPLDGLLRQPKRLAVLIYLTCTADRGLARRDKVAALFWPELPTDRARAALRTTLSRLRDDLGPDLIITRGSDEFGVDPRLVWCDLVALESRLATGDVLGAHGLYRGPFLDGVHVEGSGEALEDWIAAERARVPAALLGALDRAADLAVAERRADDARQLVMAAMAVAPTDERLARRLITLHLAEGDRGSAVRVYEAVTERLRREFDVAPSDETRALVEPLPRARADDRGARVGVRVGSGGSESLGGAGSDAAAMRPSGASDAPGPWQRTRHLTMALGAVALVAAGALGTDLLRRSGMTTSDTARDWTLVHSDQGRREGRIWPSVFLDSSERGLAVVGGLLATDPLSFAPGLLRLRGLDSPSPTSWTGESQSGPTPRPRWQAALAYDPATDRALLFGGAHGTAAPCSAEAWVLDDASGLRLPPTWRPVRARGDAPARGMASVHFDATARALVVLGGHDCLATHFRDAWLLRFDDSTLASGAWERVSIDSTAAMPIYRMSPSFAYDRVGDRALMFGGTSAAPLRDLWVLDGILTHRTRPARWRELGCSGVSPARTQGAMVFDDSTDALALLGGVDAGGDPSAELSLVLGLTGDGAACRWVHRPGAASGPIPRAGAFLRFAPRSRQLMLYGGTHRGAALLDVWVLPDPFAR